MLDIDPHSDYRNRYEEQHTTQHIHQKAYRHSHPCDYRPYRSITDTKQDHLRQVPLHLPYYERESSERRHSLRYHSEAL